MEKLKNKFGFKDKQELPTDTIGMYENEKIDSILLEQKWVCPIRFDQYSNSAYYRTVSDDITVPLKSQFKRSLTNDGIFEDGQEYYSTLIHEMIHSTGHKTRLNRSFAKKGEKDYAREELVAELGAALVSNVLGFSSRVLNNSAAYLDYWVGKLKQQPKYIVSVLSDVNKAARMVLEVVNKDKPQILKTA